MYVCMYVCMTGYLDLRGNKIISPSEIDMDRKLIVNLDTDSNQDLSAVNMTTLKNKVEPKADKDYVDGEIANFVKKSGDQMNGDLILVLTIILFKVIPIKL